jgi:hypothetical protein
MLLVLLRLVRTQCIQIVHLGTQGYGPDPKASEECLGCCAANSFKLLWFLHCVTYDVHRCVGMCSHSKACHCLAEGLDGGSSVYQGLAKGVESGLLCLLLHCDRIHELLELIGIHG